MGTYRLKIPLRWSDLDLQGHVNNVRALDFAQEARARFMASSAHPELLSDGTVVVNQKSEFRAPMLISDGPIEIELGTTSIGAARFIMVYRIRQHEKLCARISTIMCPYDFHNQRVRMLNAGEREVMAGIQTDDDAWRELPHMPLEGEIVQTELAPRWSDQDPNGHVNNVRILDWLQQSRIEATTAMAPGMVRQSGDKAGGSWVVARQDTDYVDQLRWQVEPYKVLTGVLRVGETSVTLGCEIIDPADDTAHVRARTILVHTGVSGQAEPLPEQVRTQLRSRLITSSAI